MQHQSFNHCGIIIVSTQEFTTSSPLPCADDEIDGFGGVRRQLFQSPMASKHHVPDGMMVDTVECDTYFLRSHPYNQNAEFLGMASPVACVFNSMAFMRHFFLGTAPMCASKPFLESWTSDHAEVLAVLVEGSQYKALYDELVVPQQKQLLGKDNVDSYVMPDEVQHELLHGVLSGRVVAGFSKLCDFLSNVQLTQLLMASPKNTLKVALARACEDIQSKGPHAVAYMLICMGKASTILSCGHSSCYALHWDSHIWNIEKMEESASVLFKSSNSQSLLGHMSGRYSADSPCYLFAFMPEGFHHVHGQSCQLCSTHGFHHIHGQSMVSPAMEESDNDVDDDDDGRCNGHHVEKIETAAVTWPPEVIDVFDVPQVAVSSMPNKVDIPHALDAGTMSLQQAENVTATSMSDRHLEMVMTTPPQKLDNQTHQTQPNKVEMDTAPSAAVGNNTPAPVKGWAKLRGCHGSCGQSPNMQTPMKTSPPNKRVVDVVASQQLCGKRRRKSKEETAIAQTGKSMAFQLGIDFHAKFQPAHGFHLEAKHWMKFQMQLAKGLVSPSDLNCAACTEIMDEVAVAYQALVEEGVECAPSRPVTVAHAGFTERLEELKRLEGMTDIPLGRRAPGHSDHSAPLWQDLYRWLNVRRPGMYVVLGTGKVDLKCTLCMSKFSAHRTSNIFFVLQHEAHGTHHRLLTSVKKMQWREIEWTVL